MVTLGRLSVVNVEVSQDRELFKLVELSSREGLEIVSSNQISNQLIGN